MREVFDGFEVVLTDSAPGALPGLSHPAAAAFVAAIGITARGQGGLDGRGPLLARWACRP